MKTFKKINEESLLNSNFVLPVDLDKIYMKHLKPIDNKDGSKSYRHPFDRNYITIEKSEVIVRLEAIVKDFSNVIKNTKGLAGEIRKGSITETDYEMIIDLLAPLMSMMTLIEIRN